MVVSWKNDLGSPTKPAVIVVKGLGAVTVRQEDIDVAAAALARGLDLVELIDARVSSEGLRQFIIGRFR